MLHFYNYSINCRTLILVHGIFCNRLFENVYLIELVCFHLYFCKGNHQFLGRYLFITENKVKIRLSSKSCCNKLHQSGFMKHFLNHSNSFEAALTLLWCLKLEQLAAVCTRAAKNSTFLAY